MQLAHALAFTQYGSAPGRSVPGAAVPDTAVPESGHMRVSVPESGHMRVRRTHFSEIRHQYTHLSEIRHLPKRRHRPARRGAAGPRNHPSRRWLTSTSSRLMGTEESHGETILENMLMSCE